MIPRSYRDRVRVNQALRRFAIAGALLVLVGVGTAGVVRWRVSQNLALLARLQQDAGSALSVGIRIDALRVRKTALERDASALAALRAGGMVARISDALQQSLSADVWLTTLHYARAEQLAAAANNAPLTTGQFQQGPAGAAPQATPETWQVLHRLEVSGASARYPALTDFLRTLAGRPGVREVRLVESSAAGDAAGADVEKVSAPTTGDISFSISAALDTPAAAPSALPGAPQ